MKDEIIRKTVGLVAKTLEELSIDCYVFGTCVRQQLKKYIIAKGGPWGAVAFYFIDRTNEEEVPKLMLASFRNDGSVFKRYSYFIVRNKEEAKTICKIIKESFNVEDD